MQIYSEFQAKAFMLLVFLDLHLRIFFSQFYFQLLRLGPQIHPLYRIFFFGLS